MSPTFTEKELHFAFDDQSWTIVKCDEEPFYRNQIQKLKTTKAVDFIGVLGREDCYFIEVKDYRQGPVLSESKLEDVSQAVAQKVRDSISVVFGALRNDVDRRRWRPLARGIANPRRRLRVVLWAEESTQHRSVERLKQRASVLGNLLKRKLRWLTREVLVTNCQIGGSLPDAQVTYV